MATIVWRPTSTPLYGVEQASGFFLCRDKNKDYMRTLIHPQRKKTTMSKLKKTALYILIAAVLSALGTAVIRHYQDA